MTSSYRTFRWSRKLREQTVILLPGKSQIGKDQTDMNSLDNYNQLKTKVSQVLLEGKERARQAVERERVRSYHEVGGLMHDYLA